MASSAESQQRTVAITGAGDGLGREMALQLADKGYRVFGTALSADEAENLAKESQGGVALTVTDITDQDAVDAWAREVSDALGDRGLDVLIGNAGILTPGPLEALPIEAVKREFDVNVFGALIVINAFLPALRKSPGRIIQIGSFSGRFPIPFNGPSSASKATIDAFAAIYRAELKPFGVDFVMAEPGNMRTTGVAKSVAAIRRRAESLTDEQRKLYGEAFAKFEAAFTSMQNAGMSVEESAAKVIELIDQAPAPIHAPLGKDAEEFLGLLGEKSDAELDELRLQLAGLADE